MKMGNNARLISASAMALAASLSVQPAWAQAVQRPPSTLAEAAPPNEAPGAPVAPTIEDQSAEQLAPPVAEQDADIVVTGSRVATANNAPTPITIVSPAALAATTPSTLPQALQKLPVFMGSTGLNNRANGGANLTGATLNLRNFGVNRNLVLLDGHRVAPNYANGAVNVDTLPEMLIDRIDVVTGGASAIYGSDAVSGVINFILNKKFNGLKVQANYGISGQGLAERYQAGFAYGTDLFGGRGHFEGTVRGFHQKQVLIRDLPYGKDGAAYGYSGNGTAAFPYTLINQARRNDQPVTGLISCGGCAANGLTFVQNGILGPLDRGTVTAGSPTVSNGGQGRVDEYSSAQGALKNLQSFGRFSYDVTNDITFWAEARGSKAEYFSNGPTNGIPAGAFGSGSARPNVFFTDNPFLTPQTRALLEQGNNQRYTDFNGVTHTYFTYVNYQTALSGTDSPALASTNQRPIFAYISKDRNLSGSLGFDGKVGRFDFGVSYSHDDNRSRSINPVNTNFQAEYAANDAVQLPNGSIACYVSTTANAGLYPGCVPTNPFGYNSLTKDQYAGYQRRTEFVQTNRLDNIDASIAGTLFELPAGPLRAAVSGNARWASYEIESNAPPGLVNCGTNVLRICSNATPAWSQITVASLPKVTQNVQEAALELNIPLLRDVPLIQSLSVNAAGRYTHYSTSGSVGTWKFGADYRVSDAIRFRGTISDDIRAPTLNDLFLPRTIAQFSLADRLTGRTGDLIQYSQGNPNLKPERARTYTAGVVITPPFIPGLTFSADFYSIRLKDAITSISYTATAVQQICLAAIAAGTGPSDPYCALASRPNALTDTSAANFPTAITQLALNSAVQETKGWDFELRYNVPLDKLNIPGEFTWRSLLSYQPYLRNTPFPGAVTTITPQPHYRLTTFASYSLKAVTVSVQNRWLSSWDQATFAGQTFAQQRIKAYNQLDLTVDYAPIENVHVYLTVEDLFNKKYPIAPLPTAGANPGINYPVPAGFGQYLNRYFTFGVRKSF